MTYGTSHLLTGVGGYFQGEGQEKILLCKGCHYMKNKNIGGCVLSTQPDQQKKAPMQKCAKNAKNYQTLKILPRSFRSLGILQTIPISGAANRQAPVQYAKYVVVFSKQSS